MFEQLQSLEEFIERQKEVDRVAADVANALPPCKGVRITIGVWEDGEEINASTMKIAFFIPFEALRCPPSAGILYKGVPNINTGFKIIDMQNTADILARMSVRNVESLLSEHEDVAAVNYSMRKFSQMLP